MLDNVRASTSSVFPLYYRGEFSLCGSFQFEPQVIPVVEFSADLWKNVTDKGP